MNSLLLLRTLLSNSRLTPHASRLTPHALSRGFEVEGTKRNALLLEGGGYVNELYMAKLLIT